MSADSTLRAVDHDDGDLRFRAYLQGSGAQTVLILPGGPGYPALTMLADAGLISDHYQVLLIDPPGTGGTPRQLNHELHPAAVSRFVKSACDRLGVQPFAVVGWSFGGLVAVYMVAQCSGMVEKVVLVGTNVSGVEVDPDPAAMSFRQNTLERHRDAPWYPEAWRVFNDWTELTLDAKTPGELLEMNILIDPLYLSRPSDPGVRKRLSAMEREMTIDMDAMKAWESGHYQGLDARPEARSISAPVLVISGEHDWLAGPPFAAATAQEFPHSTLRVLSDCGHMPAIEQPEVYREILLEWLSK